MQCIKDPYCHTVLHAGSSSYNLCACGNVKDYAYLQIMACTNRQRKKLIRRLVFSNLKALLPEVELLFESYVLVSHLILKSNALIINTAIPDAHVKLRCLSPSLRKSQ